MGIGQQIINGTYGLDNRPLTAYEELKAWYEKHSNIHKQITIVPETKNYYLTIYIEDFTEEIIYFSFDSCGNWYGTGFSTAEEMEYHIKCSEKERETLP